MSFLNISACSYEGSMFGWKIGKTETGLETQMNYGFNVTQSSIKAIAISKCGKYLAIGGMDERIRLFDAIENKSLGELSIHTGAITCLKFFEDTFLISGSEDHTICIWRTSDWTCIHSMKGHTNSINDISIHPSGKVAISISNDKSLRMWNLMLGNCSYTISLKRCCNNVSWNLTGTHYFLTEGNDLNLYSAEDNSVIFTIHCVSRINKATFTNVSITAELENRIVVICENKSLLIYNLEGKQVISN